MTGTTALRILSSFVLSSFVALGLAACSTAYGFNDVQIAKTALLGFTEQDMRMCAGFPSRTDVEGDISV